MEVELDHPSENSENQGGIVPMEISIDPTDQLTVKNHSPLADHPLMRAQKLFHTNPKLKVQSRVKAPKKDYKHCGNILPYLVRSSARAHPK